MKMKMVIRRLFHLSIKSINAFTHLCDKRGEKTSPESDCPDDNDKDKMID